MSLKIGTTREGNEDKDFKFVSIPAQQQQQ
jgi:hypothetical protein